MAPPSTTLSTSLAPTQAPYLVAGRRFAFPRTVLPRVFHPKRAAHRTSAPRAIATGEVSSDETVSTASPSAACRAAQYGKMDFEKEREVAAEVTGTIPNWLEGTLVMNGPSYMEGMNHMFDGYAVVHKWRIEQGKVFSSHKYLQSEAYKAYRETGKMRFTEFGTHVFNDGISGKLRSVLDLLRQLIFGLQGSSDNCSVNITSLGSDKWMATSEPPFSHYLFDPKTLELGDQLSMGPDVKLDIATAHHSALSNGDLINVGTKFGEGYEVYRVDSKSLECTSIRKIPARYPSTPSWIHDFPATEDYVVIVEQPVVYNTGAALFGSAADHVIFDWKPEDSTLFHVVPLDSSKEVLTFSTAPFFVFHFGNAFLSDDGSNLCFDVSQYDDPTIINDLLLDTLRSGNNELSKASAWRYELPLDGQTSGTEVQGRPLIPGQDYFDFPVFNQNYRGKENRYMYGLTAVRPTCDGNALCKMDLMTGMSTVWHEPGTSAGDSVFLPNPDSTSEDDGVLMAQISGADGCSHLLFLDGMSFQEVARAKLPYGMTARFHGEFIPA